MLLIDFSHKSVIKDLLFLNGFPPCGQIYDSKSLSVPVHFQVCVSSDWKAMVSSILNTHTIHRNESLLNESEVPRFCLFSHNAFLSLCYLQYYSIRFDTVKFSFITLLHKPNSNSFFCIDQKFKRYIEFDLFWTTKVICKRDSQWTGKWLKNFTIKKSP